MNPNLILLVLRVIPALILSRAALLKLTSNERSVELFTSIEMEPIGRVLIGMLEALSVLLLLQKWSAVYGASLGLAIMVGAVIGHATVLGFAGASFTWFLSACLVAVCCSGVVYLRRDQNPLIRNMFEM